MITIKLNNQFPEWDWLRQTPGGSGIWKDAKFFVNKDEVSACDYFFVMGGLLKNEKIICPKENTVFIALENRDIQHYEQSFLNQFHYVLTHRDDIKHPRVIKTVFPAYWFIGRKQRNNINIEWSKSYDELTNSDTASPKERLISVISSNKVFTEGHKKRLEFVEKLRQYFGSTLDVFGRGVNEIEDKWDAIAPYKYHIVLENSSLREEITEKLYDTYLAQTYPIYYGAPNVNDYFNNAQLTIIDINKPAEAMAIIKKCIEDDTYWRNKNAILEAKKNVLNGFNLFNIIYGTAKSINNGNEAKESSSIEHLFKVEQHKNKSDLYFRFKNKIRRIIKNY